MKSPRKVDTKGVDEPKVLPAILDAASKQASLRPLAGSGKGLWSRDGPASPARLREEWSR